MPSLSKRVSILKTCAAEDVGAIASFVGGLSREVDYELLPYHPFGEPKYRELGRDYPLPDLQPPSPERMAELSRIARDARRAAEPSER